MVVDVVVHKKDIKHPYKVNFTMASFICCKNLNFNKPLDKSRKTLDGIRN